MPKGLANENGIVMFGDPLSEKAFNALKRNSPTANAILNTIPKEAFEQIKLEQQALEERIKKELNYEEERVNSNLPIEKKLSRLEMKKLGIKSVNNDLKINVKNDIKKSVKNDSYFMQFIDTFFLCSFDNIKKIPNMNLTVDYHKNKELYKEEVTVDFLNYWYTYFETKKEPTTIKILKQKELTMNLDDELESLKASTSPNENPEIAMKAQIFSLLESKADAPSENQIRLWKEEFGSTGVHVMAFGQDDVYIYHHLTRKQWRTIKDIMSKTDPEQTDEVEEKLKQKVCLGCVLYPKLQPIWVENCKAGVIDSLYQMILLNSGFLTPQQAMLLTTQL